MDFERARFNMVEQQVRPWEVLNTEVLDTLMCVRRELFVPATHRNLAFADIRIPIGHGQVMLEPSIEGKILQAAAIRKTDKVLEIGTGSGYMAALLAAHAEWVRSIEIDPRIAAFAHNNLADAGVENVIVEEGDGTLGWPERAPYDVIVYSGGVAAVAPEVLEQLKPGGRLIAFVGQAPVFSAQCITRREDGGFDIAKLFESSVPVLQTSRRPAFVF